MEVGQGDGVLVCSPHFGCWSYFRLLDFRDSLGFLGLRHVRNLFRRALLC